MCGPTTQFECVSHTIFGVLDTTLLCVLTTPYMVGYLLHPLYFLQCSFSTSSFLNLHFHFASNSFLSIPFLSHPLTSSPTISLCSPYSYLEASSNDSCHCSCHNMATLISSSDTMTAC